MRNGCGRRQATMRAAHRNGPSVREGRSVIGLPSREALEFVATLMDADIFVISEALLGVRTTDTLYWIDAG